MKNLDLNAMGVTEMKKKEMKKKNGGFILLALLKYYPWDDTAYMQAHNKALLMK